MQDIQNCDVKNLQDDDKNPTGGHVMGQGIDIHWQNGPLGAGKDRKAPNGAFVETVIAAALQRIEYYQTANEGKFSCRENALAITKLQEALFWLDFRTKGREKRGVEGTHQK